jgi:hypothetical protein
MTGKIPVIASRGGAGPYLSFFKIVDRTCCARAKRLNTYQGWASGKRIRLLFHNNGDFASDAFFPIRKDRTRDYAASGPFLYKAGSESQFSFQGRGLKEFYVHRPSPT